MRTKFAIVVTAFVALASLGVTAVGASSPSYESPSSWKSIPPMRSGVAGDCVVPANRPIKNGTKLVEGECSGEPGWLVGRPIDKATGQRAVEKQFRLRGTGYCLGVKSGAYDHGHLWQCENFRGEVNTSQMWRQTEVSTGRFTLKNKRYGKCLHSYKDWTGVVPQYTLTSCTPHSEGLEYSDGRH